MKKILILILVLLIAIGGFFFIKNRKNNSPQNSNNVISKKEESKIEAFFEQKESWEDLENDYSGIYDTGFYFIDIDLDGEKELAVQLGGGSMRNCVTKFYKINKSKLQECNFFEEGYSFAVGNLVKYIENSGKSIYINNNSLKVDASKYMTSIDKITEKAKTQNLFSVEENYKEDGSIDRVYYIAQKEVTEEEYQNSYNEFFGALKQEEIYTYFVPFRDWKTMSTEEQRKALETSYNYSKLSYNNVATSKVKEINLEDYEPIDVNLTGEIYGNSFNEIKEAFGNEIPAQIYTDKNSFIYVVPAPDLLDNMIYYYQNAKLIAYKREFMGIGGSVTYYFNNDKLVSIDKTKLEPEMEFTPEDEVSILVRSESTWNKWGR